jgi:polysaccharide pyruvyl transferase WcaK-like protein
LRVRVARLFRKKIYFYAVGIDIKNPENSKKLEKIFKKAWKITVRDVKSQQHLKKL